MAGAHLTLRRTTDKALVDGLWLGETIINTPDWSYGVDVGFGVPLWYPGLDSDTNRMVMLEEQVLTGKDAAKNNNIQVSFGTDNALIIQNTLTSETLLSATTTSQVFKRGADDLINRSAPQSLEIFTLPKYQGAPNNTIALTKTTADQHVGGNFYLWLKDPMSDLGIDFHANYPMPNVLDAVRAGDDADKGWHLWQSLSGPALVKAASTKRYQNGVGLRSWVYHPDASRMKLTFVMFAYMAPTGGIFNTRIGYPDNYRTWEIEKGTDPYAVHTFQYDPAWTAESNHGKPLGIDWFYNVRWDDTSSGAQDRSFILGGLQVLPGWYTPEQITPAFLAREQNLMYSKAYATGTKLVTAYGDKVQYINFDVPMLRDDYEVKFTNATYSITVVTKTRWGFTYRASGAPTTTSWSFEYNAYCKGDVSDV